MFQLVVCQIPLLIVYLLEKYGGGKAALGTATWQPTWGRKISIAIWKALLRIRSRSIQFWALSLIGQIPTTRSVKVGNCRALVQAELQVALKAFSFTFLLGAELRMSNCIFLWWMCEFTPMEATNKQQLKQSYRTTTEKNQLLVYIQTCFCLLLFNL